MRGSPDRPRLPCCIYILCCLCCLVCPWHMSAIAHSGARQSSRIRARYMAAVLEQVRLLEQWLWLLTDHGLSCSHQYTKCTADVLPHG